MTVTLRVTPLEERCVPAVTFRFDATLDRSGFFANPAALAALDRAGQTLGSRLQDRLAAITPGNGNSWEARFYDPIADTTRRIPNLVVKQDEIIVFVAASTLDGVTLAETTAGYGTPTGSAAWKRTVLSRGQSGTLADPAADYGPWGAMTSFNSKARWSFTAELPPANLVDFQSVAEHELGHVLGFGLGADSFDNQVVSRKFVGKNSEASYGGPVPLDTEDRADHWDNGVTSNGVEAAMTPAVARGTRREFTPLDFAALADIGWSVSGVNAAAAPPPTVPGGNGNARFAVGAGAGFAPTVTLLDATGRSVGSFDAFSSDFTGGVRVASADFDGDGILDTVVATGPGVPVRVRVLSGSDRHELFAVSPFEDAFTGGAFVAAGDLNGDGVPDLVITPDTGGGPRVAGYGGQSISKNAPLQLFPDFFAFEETLRDGVYLASSDINGDGYAEILAGAGPGGGPRVTAFDGRNLIRNGNPTRVADFFAGDPLTRGGVRLGTADLDGDGRPDLVTGTGTGGGSAIDGYRATKLGGTPQAEFEYTVYPGFDGGVFVG